MYAVQKPSEKLFVVHTARDRAEVEDELKSLAKVEELKGGKEMLLLNFRRKTSDAKAAWQLIRERLGDGDVVQPVLLDDAGQPQYPTGEISVRFHTAPTDAQLKRFAASHGLRLQSRNEYVAQQAIFEPLKPAEHYVPELVEKISGEKNIQLAWANTLSRYERL